MNPTFQYILLAAASLSVAAIAFKWFKQRKLIRLYEQQKKYPVTVYPGATKFFMGNLSTFGQYQKAKKTDPTITSLQMWMMHDIMRLSGSQVGSGKKGGALKNRDDKYERAPQIDTSSMDAYFFPIVLLYIVGEVRLQINEPELIKALVEEGHGCFDKNQNSYLRKINLGLRFKDNAMTLEAYKKDTDQQRRRDTISGGLAQDSENNAYSPFEILDNCISEAFDQFLKDMKQKTEQTVDLRGELCRIFDKVMATFIFGKDLTQVTVASNILGDSGMTQQDLPFFESIGNAKRTSQLLNGQIAMFGESGRTAKLRARQENWNAIGDVIKAAIVEILEGQGNKNCLVGKLLESDQYKNNLEHLASDMFICLYASAEPCRNLTVTALSHLIKSESALQKVRNELMDHIKNHPVLDTLEENVSAYLKCSGSRGSPYLDYILKESMRFQPPEAFGNDLVFIKDCQIGGVKFFKGTTFNVGICYAHHNPHQWQRPNEFLPERFDPSSELFKTPNGSARHDYSFIPFGIGKRQCFGKDMAVRIVHTILSKTVMLINFQFEQEATGMPQDAPDYPTATLGQGSQYPVHVRIKSINQDNF